MPVLEPDKARRLLNPLEGWRPLLFGGDVKTPFEEELRSLINRHSRENASNTPDYILTLYLLGCLETFEQAVQQRETWYGRDARPSHAQPVEA